MLAIPFVEVELVQQLGLRVEERVPPGGVVYIRPKYLQETVKLSGWDLKASFFALWTVDGGVPKTR